MVGNDQDRLLKEIRRNKTVVEAFVKEYLQAARKRFPGEIVDVIVYGFDINSVRERSFFAKVIFEHYGGNEDDLRDLSVAVELLNASTFFLDDIFDNSIKRANKDTVWQKYGLSKTITVHEILRSLCYSLILRLCEKPRGGRFPSLRTLGILNDLFLDVYLGQYLDIGSSLDGVLSTENYFNLVGLTTGSQFQAICRLAAISAGAPDIEENAIGKAGFNFGVCAQIRDDVVDFIGDEDVVGKKTGLDFSNKRPRLPLIIYAREKGLDIRLLFEEEIDLGAVGNFALPYIRPIVAELEKEGMSGLRFAKGTNLFDNINVLFELANSY